MLAATTAIQSSALMAPLMMSAAIEPLFEAGPVRFYQAADIQHPVEAQTTLLEPLSLGRYLHSNEYAFETFYPSVQEMGGVLLGVGSLQNLNLSAAMQASGMIFVDIDPNVSLTLALVLPLLARHDRAADFVNEATQLVDKEASMSPFLDPIPTDFQLAFGAHIHFLRQSKQIGGLLPKLLRRFQSDPHTFLVNESYYRHVSEIVQSGVSVVYGSILSAHLPGIVEGAMTFHEDSIRAVYLSNAPEKIAQHFRGAPIDSFLEVLQSESVDPEGRVLMTTELGTSGPLRQFRQSDFFTYHARGIEEARALLEEEGDIGQWVAHWRLNPQIQLASDIPHSAG